MIDYATARRTMVDNQVRTNDVTDLRLIDAISAVPRELFVPPAFRPFAYIDEHLKIGPGTGAGPRFLMQPVAFAKLLDLVDIRPGDRVLIVGAGSGYSAAVASLMGGTVFALEQDPALADEAERTLLAAGIGGITLLRGPLTRGAPDLAPFDAILVEGSVEVLPADLFAQLGPGGRLVAVEGQGLAGRARLYTASAGEVSGRNAFNCAAKPLPGFEKTAEFSF